MKKYIEYDAVLRYCNANKAIAEREISEVLKHTAEYISQYDLQYARQRKRDMEDAIRFIESLPKIGYKDIEEH